MPEIFTLCFHFISTSSSCKQRLSQLPHTPACHRFYYEKFICQVHADAVI
ncbi:hypothetical protein MITSMUL_03804 [Mitsuokella multacida DSM 20544]|uniref:Uncharacterized protein n=1 Tax=Mitsuokella multacida DSM 20544 TaxID=500635 RepID=C9KKV3_9FIRM|nr:hypothetical protein MITSMUL_03804 [Mitsuokella multacida DSM 20544]